MSTFFDLRKVTKSEVLNATFSTFLIAIALTGCSSSNPQTSSAGSQDNVESVDVGKSFDVGDYGGLTFTIKKVFKSETNPSTGTKAAPGVSYLIVEYSAMNHSKRPQEIDYDTKFILFTNESDPVRFNSKTDLRGMGGEFQPGFGRKNESAFFEIPSAQLSKPLVLDLYGGGADHRVDLSFNPTAKTSVEDTESSKNETSPTSSASETSSSTPSTSASETSSSTSLTSAPELPATNSNASTSDTKSSSEGENIGQPEDDKAQAVSRMEAADSKLNEVYKKVLQSNKANVDFIRKLNHAEKLWIGFRDAHIKSYYPKDDKKLEYGDMFWLGEFARKQEASELRTKQLEKLLSFQTLPSENAQAIDKNLNSTYQKALKAFDLEDVKSFRQAQMAWIAFRDADADAFCMLAGQPQRAARLSELTKDRTDELQQWVDGVPEGTVGQGTLPVKNK